jgi:hypothetical protein
LIYQALRQLYDWQLWWMVPAFVLALYGLWRSRREAVTRQLTAFTVLALVGLLAVAAVFMLGWQGYVPRRTGASRLILEASLLGPPLIAIGLGRLAATFGLARGGRLLSPPAARLGLVLALLTVCGAVSLVRVAHYDDGQAPSRAQLAVWRSIPAEPSDVILANGYTEGFIPDLTGAQGLLDGRAPYTFDAQLHRANRLLRQAQAFFARPARNWNYLARHHVSWVVVGVPGSYSLGTLNMWDVPEQLTGLERCSGLRRFAEGDGLTVFRVVDPGPSGCRG